VFTYTQEKIGWNYFYVKRKVLANEIHTVPLNITLSYAKRIRKLTDGCPFQPKKLSVPFLYLRVPAGLTPFRGLGRRNLVPILLPAHPLGGGRHEYS
jgi:hypothetical protein